MLEYRTLKSVIVEIPTACTEKKRNVNATINVQEQKREKSALIGVLPMTVAAVEDDGLIQSLKQDCT